MSMREKIARALYDLHPGTFYYPQKGTSFLSWEQISEEDRAGDYEAADAVLAAMREPTEAMVAEAWIKRGNLDEGATFGIVAANIWRAMIDAAIREADELRVGT